MVDNIEKKGESKYNLNESDFRLIGDLQQQAFYYRNERKNYYEAFQRWVSIRLLLDSRFTPDENKELDKIEEKFMIMPKPEDLPYFNNSQIPMNKKRVVYKIYTLNKYIKKLRELMKKYKIALTDMDRKVRLD